MSLCVDCCKRQYCIHLCPEAEAYVNQDHVSLQELTVGSPYYIKPYKVDIELKEYQALLTRRPDLDDQVLSRRRRIMKRFGNLSRKEQVAVLLEAGMSRAVIAATLGITRPNLRKIIERIKKSRLRVTKRDKRNENRLKGVRQGSANEEPAKEAKSNNG